jgi:hypothetical protein
MATLTRQQDSKAPTITGQTPVVPSGATGQPTRRRQSADEARQATTASWRGPPTAAHPCCTRGAGADSGQIAWEFRGPQHPAHPSAITTPSPAPQSVSPRPGVPAAALPPASSAVPSGSTVHPPGAPAVKNTATPASPQIVNRPPPKPAPPSPKINRPASPPPVANHPPSPPVAVNRPSAPVVNRPSPPPSAAAVRPAPQAAKKCVVQNGKQVCE